MHTRRWGSAVIMGMLLLSGCGGDEVVAEHIAEPTANAATDSSGIDTAESPNSESPPATDAAANDDRADVTPADDAQIPVDDPNVDPEPAPDPETDPASEPAPEPEPEPEPAPESDPDPDPDPAPEPNPEPDPDPNDPPAIDSEYDGVYDADDNCPLTPNGTQADGDADGIGDMCDCDAAGTLLPDLMIWADEERDYLYDGYIDTQLIPGVTLYRFSAVAVNIGVHALELQGGAVVDDTQQVFQQITHNSGCSYGQLAGHYVHHPQHGHIHYDGFSIYRLRTMLPDGGIGPVVGTQNKVSFCVRDDAFYSPSPPGTPSEGTYVECESQTQGLSVGWADVYGKNLWDQWVDVTNVPNGEYWLEAEIDPDHVLEEVDENNNVTRIQITLEKPEAE